jgi:RecA-family ATPase
LVPGLSFPPPKWLVEGLWPEKAVGFIAGPPKAGKSWLAQDLAIALCTGGDFLGRPVQPLGPVLFFSGEMSIAEIAERADPLLAGRGLTREDLTHRLFFSELPLSLEDSQARGRIVDAVKETRAAMVFIDPLARFLREADENAASQMRTVNNFIRQDLNRGCGVAVCVVHHTNKHGGGMRGTGDFRALSEVTLSMSEPERKGTKVSVEMRRARQPEPFYVQRIHEADGTVRLSTNEIAPAADRVQKARELLSGAVEGVTLDRASAILGVRRAAVRELLEQAGGAPDGPNGRWVFARPELKMAS